MYIQPRDDQVKPPKIIESSEGRDQLEDEIRLRAEPEHSEQGRAVIERVETATATGTGAPEASPRAAAIIPFVQVSGNRRGIPPG